ncbi:MAG: UDP-glucose 4-epimerase GalE, partial [Terriglobales bacterium]
RILITGGAGYIGGVMAETLLERGHAVVVLDSLVHGYRDNVPAEARLVAGDLADPPALAAAFAAPVDGVIHMAAHIEVAESMREPRKYLDNNLARPWALLEAMERAGTRRFVLSSTAAVYGQPEATPIAETAPPRPVNPYGLSKLMLEQTLHWHATTRGLRYAALRYFNAAGATARHGERHQPESHLIPLVLAAAAGEREAIRIFGADYDTPDGTCVRDYIHVRDLAEAHLIALARLEAEEAPPADLAAAAYNLGNGEGFSVRQVIAAAERVCGRPIPVRIEARRSGDPPRLVASAEKMRAAGWQPRHTSLDEIVASAWNWKMAQ